jgi:protein TonB
MVPPEEIDLNAPTTLPADFGEWDSGEAAAAQAAAAAAPEVVPAPAAAKPQPKAATARVAVLPAAGRAPSAPPPPRPAASAYTEVEPVYQPPQPQRAKAADARPKAESAPPEKKKTGMIAGIVVLALLLGGGALGLVKMRSKAVPANQPVATQTTPVNTPSSTQAPSTPANGSTPAAANTAANNTQTAETPPQDRPLSPQALAIAQSANATSRIQKDLSMLKGAEAPPSADFGSAGAEGLGAASNPFSGQSGPKVKVAQQKVTISTGSAVALLVKSTPPAYPAIAKQARVQGIVVIQATIAKSGAVGNLRAVSGPAMLRQAALDSVKNWRFKPYMLDGEPIEVDTTVNVNFVLPQ